MNPKGRPKDLIDRIEAIAAEHGYFEPVDENYYQAFVELNQSQIEKLAIALMLDQEKEVRRLAGGKADSAAVASVSKFVRIMFTGISLGFARFDAFGNFGFVARVGFEPTVEMDEIMAEKFKVVEPMIMNIVRGLCLGCFPAKSVKASCPCQDHRQSRWLEIA
jgi:hypothetical protein